jgi:hypothetical protein
MGTLWRERDTCCALLCYVLSSGAGKRSRMRAVQRPTVAEGVGGWLLANRSTKCGNNCFGIDLSIVVVVSRHAQVDYCRPCVLNALEEHVCCSPGSIISRVEGCLIILFVLFVFLISMWFCSTPYLRLDGSQRKQWEYWPYVHMNHFINDWASVSIASSFVFSVMHR